MMARYLAIPAIALVLVSVPALAQGGPNAARPGDPVLERPTLLCLGVRWSVAGDANANASVAVAYRRVGEAQWREALPLFRVETAKMVAEVAEGTSLLAGSIFDLEQGTEYEMRLRLSDPDGGDGERVLRATTRVEPQAWPDGRTLHVIPGTGGGGGTEGDPFRGLTAAEAEARPGDILLLHAGVYSGTWSVRKSGEPGRPIVWRGAGAGEAVIDGGGAERAISANGLRHVFFEGLSVRNARWGIVAHGTSDLVVRRCHIYDVNSGLTATRQDSPMTDFFIADNLIEGPSTWPRTKGIESAEGVEVVGEGHVVCYNRIHGFADAVSIFHGPPSNSIDFHNNEISECTDDGIEMDYGEQNVRCFRNRLTNCFQGISTQPLHGGPCYIFRNAMYNVQHEPFKMHNSPSGALMLHNTSVKSGMPLVMYASASNCVYRNNIFIGTDANYALEFTGRMTDCDFDYDGWGGGTLGTFAKWNGVRYRTLEDMQKSGALEAHAVWVDPGKAFADGLLPPTDVETQFPIETNKLWLGPESDAVDRGEVLPNINDGFAGAGPDLGAYEALAGVPHYGIRPVGRQAPTREGEL